MAFDKTWDETKPAGSRKKSLGDDDIREGKYATRERMAIDRRWYASESGKTYVGYANQISYVNSSSDPATHAGGGVSYTKAGELYFKDDDANVQALTNIKRSHSTIGHVLANQSSAPTTFATGCVLYAVGGELYVVDGAGNAVAITLSGGLTSGNRHMINRGFGLTYNSTSALYVEPGTLHHNYTQVNTTARTTLTLATDADWIDGTQPAVLTSIHIYVYVSAAGEKKLEETAPAYADTAGNTVGKLIYHKEGTVYWRWIGSVWTDTADAIVKFYNIGDWIHYDEPYADADVQGIDATSDVATFTAASFAAKGIPATSQKCNLSCVFNTQNANLNITFNARPTGSSATYGQAYNFESQTGSALSIMIPSLLLDSAQSLDYKATFNNGDFDGYVEGYYNPRN